MVWVEPWMEAEWHDARLERKAARYPECTECGRKIFPGDYATRIGYAVVCDECLKDYLELTGERTMVDDLDT